ncbi:O-antigen ligase family protein [Anaerobacillus sp. CMMVII]|uniref:O-antigen ligase family protein n=1 Tax=Anaerobacillus sp. CMMVII TaxID=2755588 RepID=UPI0021B7813B|nr:O-antigen ligase family protein [Anaerobacillus sp. CMMVII]MCT8139018.1 O-antigen ligase family protein [Anaerobacillus sp. CMMVII]
MIHASKKHNLKIDILDDKKISIVIIAPFVVLTIQYFILIYFNLLGTADASKVQLISKALVGTIFLYGLSAVLKRSKLKIIGIYILAILIFLINYLIFPENHIYLKELIFPFFFMCLPVFIYSMSINDVAVLKQIMEKASFIVFIIGTILGFLILSGSVSAGVYSMSLSYYMLVPAIIYINDLFDKPSIRILVFVLVSLLVILALGSRGAIFCIFVFVFLKLLRPNTRLNYKKLIGYFVSIVSVMIIYLKIEDILEYLYYFLLNYGIRSRSIMLLLRDEVHLSGRDVIYDNLIGVIIQNPLLGIGLVGDRRVLGGSYAHNIFLEIASNFGVVLGLMIIFLICIIIFKLFLLKNYMNYNVFIIWFCLGFVHLLVSSSYLIDLNFWVFMGISVGLLFRKDKGKS